MRQMCRVSLRMDMKLLVYDVDSHDQYSSVMMIIMMRQ